jgi:excisionase family DNA binding protein
MADWISVEEAASISGYNTEHIRRLIRSGLIHAEKKGPMYWIDRKSLEVYVKEAKNSDDGRKGPRAGTHSPSSS